MENNQNFQHNVQHNLQQSAIDAPDGGPTYFEVTYLDTDCGRIRTEHFDDVAAADRFASRCVAGADGWAVVDAILAKEGRAAA